MGAYYDEVEIEDMAWDEEKRVYHYPCPCGDRFEISKKQLKNYEDVATCPSCSLIIRVIFDPLDFEDEPSDDEDEGQSASEDAEAESDEASGDEEFADALEHLTISDEQPKAIALTIYSASTQTVITLVSTSSENLHCILLTSSDHHFYCELSIGPKCVECSPTTNCLLFHSFSGWQFLSRRDGPGCKKAGVERLNI
ncbi:hypothetical protein VTO73DRAFT_3955 [Trametes versicolor]